MAFQEKMLAQNAPSGTSAVTFYTKPASTTAICKSIIVANTTAAPAAFSIYFHDSGTTYSAATALFNANTIPANSSVEIDTFIALNTANGTIGIKTDTANALTFTAFGAEIT